MAATMASAAEFVDLIRRTGAADPGRLDAFLARTPGPPPADPGGMADALIRAGLITRYHADAVLSGRLQRFTLSGKYRILDRLGAGGMASVFLCEHRVMRRRVAIKMLPPKLAANPSTLDRFHREARAIAAVHHPNIVGAHDIDQDGNVHFLVMEYIEGVSFHDLVRRSGTLPVARACHYIAQAAAGLQHAHDKGLVHRDVKPANLLVDRTGTVKVLDLGLALVFHQAEDDNLTRDHDANAILGTAEYLAPEQAMDSHNVDHRADIYSLGMTLYFLLTARTPYGEGTTAQKIIWHQLRPPTDVRQHRPDVPADLWAVLERMLAKPPADRPQAARDVVAALAPWTAAPIPPPTADELPRPSGDAAPSSAWGGTAGSGLTPAPTVAIAAGSALPTPLDISAGGASVARPRPVPAASGGPISASLAAPAVDLSPPAVDLSPPAVAVKTDPPRSGPRPAGGSGGLRAQLPPAAAPKSTPPRPAAPTPVPAAQPTAPSGVRRSGTPDPAARAVAADPAEPPAKRDRKPRKADGKKASDGGWKKIAAAGVGGLVLLGLLAVVLPMRRSPDRPPVVSPGPTGDPGVTPAPPPPAPPRPVGAGYDGPVPPLGRFRGSAIPFAQQPGGLFLVSRSCELRTDAPEVFGKGLFHLTDGKPDTTWSSPRADVRVDFLMPHGQPRVVKAYQLASAADAPDKDPKEWRLLGSNDPAQWDVLDTVTDAAFDQRLKEVTLTVKNDTAYKAYRVQFARANGSSELQLGELSLFAAFPQYLVRGGAGGPPAGTPYGGTAVVVAASGTTTIQAENFDDGPDGVAYHDTNAGAVEPGGGSYRPGAGVDIRGTDMSERVVGGTMAGEWLTYTVDVAQAGAYDLQVRGSGPGGTIRVSANGTELTGPLAVGGTPGFDVMAVTPPVRVSLAAGRQVLRVDVVSSGFDLDWLSLTPVGPLPAGSSPTAPPAETPAGQYAAATAAATAAVGGSPLGMPNPYAEAVAAMAVPTAAKEAEYDWGAINGQVWVVVRYRAMFLPTGVVQFVPLKSGQVTDFEQSSGLLKPLTRTQVKALDAVHTLTVKGDLAVRSATSTGNVVGNVCFPYRQEPVLKVGARAKDGWPLDASSPVTFAVDELGVWNGRASATVVSTASLKPDQTVAITRRLVAGLGEVSRTVTVTGGNPPAPKPVARVRLNWMKAKDGSELYRDKAAQ